jgi:FtsP/CotA-like multicopper oxidase with cupredoxin domain
MLFFSRRRPFEVSLWKAATYAISTRLSFFTIRRGWKDTLRLDSGDDARVIMRFDGYRGRYLMHCHNLEHEDYDMMMRFDVV